MTATPIEVHLAFRFALYVGASQVPLAGARREPGERILLWRAMAVGAEDTLGGRLWHEDGEPVVLVLYARAHETEGARAWRLRWRRTEELEFDLRADADRPAHEGVCLHGVECEPCNVPDYVEALARLDNVNQYGGREDGAPLTREEFLRGDHHHRK